MRSRILGVWLVLAACDRGESTAPSLAAREEPTRAAPDYDADGVADAHDRCPGAAGPLADGCPDPDSDGDGVLDSEDACKAEAGPQADGCPIPDSDGDTLVDGDDGCPRDKETVNGFADRDGCPDELPAELAAIAGVVSGVTFDLNKDTIRRSSFAALDGIVAVLLKHPEVHVEVTGHSDDTASNVMRGALTARRAASVKRYLVEHGVAAERVESQGYGPDRPIASNKTRAGRAQNRRIELAIVAR